ncbi:MAG: hypothetical protein QM765_18640 [Myxococcales bacterium]
MQLPFWQASFALQQLVPQAVLPTAQVLLSTQAPSTQVWVALLQQASAPQPVSP